MKTLAIETSCDETAVCVLETNSESSYSILSSAIHSQVDLHATFGGVFPMMAKREHSKNIVPLLEAVLKEAGILGGDREGVLNESTTRTEIENTIDFLKEKEPELYTALLASDLIRMKPSIDQIAVTKGPGLEPALWVGVNCARALSALWNITVVAVNHMEGHIFGSLLPHATKKAECTKLRPLALPALALLISGGHTELVLVENAAEDHSLAGHELYKPDIHAPYTFAQYTYTIVGQTKDDALGEAFDKVARMLDLPYPGGPRLHARAEEAREMRKTNAISESLPLVKLPRPMLHSGDLNFSFSGLKTAVLYLLKEHGYTDAQAKGAEAQTKKKVAPELVQAIAGEFEEAVTEVVVAKTRAAIEKYGVQTLIVGGGVIANTFIQKALEKLAQEHSISLYLPPKGVSGDNAIMIAIAGALRARDAAASGSAPIAIETVRAEGNLSL